MSTEMSTENFEIVQSDFGWEKKDIDEILKSSESIDVDKVAQEVLCWLDLNVENFVDNSMRVFKIDMVLDNTDSMTETKKLQDLYRAIPDDEGCSEEDILRAQQCRRSLDEITKMAYDRMVKNEDLLKKLFKRLIFFYEKLIPIPENKERAKQIDKELRELILAKEGSGCKDEDKIQKKITDKIKEGESLLKYQELNGSVDITKFEYEAFNVGVKIFEPETERQDKNTERKVLKEYVIPEGFTLWLELSYHLKQRPTSIF